MPYLTRPVFGLPGALAHLSLHRPRSPLQTQLSHVSSLGSTAAPARWLLHRRFSAMSRLRSDNLFEYTSGQWIWNNDLRHAEKRRIFNTNELSRLAAESINRSLADIVGLEKLAEGGFNRTFLITMQDGFRMVVRVPYPATVPKYFAVASEVATMAFLRSIGLPVPSVYGYSPTPNNTAGTEYIFMEFIQGTSLGDIWSSLGEGDIASISRQLAELESKTMSIAFPAGGSLYYAKDLENTATNTSRPSRLGIALEDKRFCVGPDTSMSLWYGRRSQLDVDRGPYESPEAALARGAEKELAYLRQFGRPLLPFQRIRREAYNFQKQLPSEHIENLEHYLRIISPLIPRDPALSHFRLRHSDLRLNNIIVSGSPNSNLRIAGLTDWQQTSILPLFLLAGVPQWLDNYGDPCSQSMERPSLPEGLDHLDETQRSREARLYRHSLAHYHYVKNTEECNKPHYAALVDLMGTLRRHLFWYATDPWEGETLALKVALIQAAENWKALGGDLPCPIKFDPDDVRRTMELDKEQRRVESSLDIFWSLIGCSREGWVPAEHYEGAMAQTKKLKEVGLAATESEGDWAQIAAHWPLDDMDEEDYM